jgi:phosphoglycolate phosphatase-like HAD superfamily hydrolase
VTRTVIFDFDGTLALGRGPIDAYVSEVIAATGESTFAAEVSETLGEFDAGRSTAIDAYDAVRQAAVARGVETEALQLAYRRSREALGTDDALVEGPEGIVPFLERLGQAADVVLATNAPATRLVETLAALGIGHLVPTRHTSVGKPEGLTALVAEALLRGPVLSVGDIYVNDLAPAAALGADTALVGSAWKAFAARTTMAAATLPELYPLIEVWAGVTTPAPPVPPGTGPTHERHH